MGSRQSRCTRPRSAASRSTRVRTRIRRTHLFSAYHPSGNSNGCRAVGHILRPNRTGPGAGSFAHLDRGHPQRVHAYEGAVPDLGPVLIRAVEVGRYRTRADVGVRSEVCIAQVGDVRHPAAAADLAPHELGKAADVHVLGYLGARTQLGEGAAVGAVAQPRVLYMDVGTDVALGADLSAALQDRERLDHRVLADDHA